MIPRKPVGRTRLIAIKNFAFCADCGHKVTGGPGRIAEIVRGVAVGVCDVCRGVFVSYRKDYVDVTKRAK